MSSIFYDTKTDITVERARQELTNATAHQARVEKSIDDGVLCCEHNEKAALAAAKKEVKRWSQWLSDHQRLEEGTTSTLPGLS